ncbi:TraB/GumN family protein [Fulvivirga sp. 29W222]|uniref:TraB/GumN family protein n=1 Tax=Fulvivirga marina TaxID=2494733 RepID=A0A937G1G3_9BACT|nr:TraB/GumN family protein [Fulvivirga marina]MBL6448431.1 TraB/GumN family protein [Fulvivirga marina]
MVPYAFRILISVILSLCFIHTQAQHEKNYSLLWRIDGNNLEAPSYLFGTMHVKDSRAFNFSDSVLYAIEKTGYFALELQPDSMLNNVFNKYFEDDQTFRHLFDDNEYQELNERFKEEKGFDLDKLNIKNPILIRSLLTPNTPKPDDKQTFVDAYLYGIAKTLRKKVFGLEKVEDQTDIFFGASREEQKQELMEVLESNTDDYRRSLEYMTDVYSRGNIEEIQRMVEHHGIMDSIMIRRNRVMTNSLKRLMNQSPTFAAVGCAHLPGENGIIHMLRKEGYTVSKVEATFTGVAEQYKIEPLKMQWYDYQDKELGYALKMPGIPIPADIFPGLNMMMYPDLISETGFFVMTIDLRGASKTVNKDEIVEKMVNGFKEKNSFKVTKRREVIKNGTPAIEIVGESNDEHMMLQITIKNNIVYCQYVNRKDEKPDKEYTEYFFNSLRAFEPSGLKAAEWQAYRYKDAAFKVLFPVPPKETHRVYEENDTRLDLVISTDIRNMSNYMIAYNDYPLGYYLDDKQEVFKSLIEEYNSVGKLLASPDTIWLQGVEGREYEIMLSNKYYTICRVYIRGNRVYKVLHQNLNENERRLPQNNFLNSFSFIPFEDEKLEEHIPEGENFKLKLFPQRQISIDSAVDHSWYTRSTTTYTLKDGKTGGVYSLEFSELKDFFKVTHLDSFYTNIIDNNILGWTDSLVSSKDVTLNGAHGKEVVSINKYNHQKTRYRFWLDDKKLFYMAAYVAEEALFNNASNTFFNSYTRPKKLSSFDVYASKADKIIKGLSASDSSLYKASIGAFNYYEFTREDLPLIYEALNTTYADDSIEGGARCKLVEELADIGEPTSLPYLKKLYKNKTTNDITKAYILSSAIKFPNDQGLELFLELFISHAPDQLGKKDWAIFKTFTDSLDLAVKHFDKLLELMDNEEYRSNILSIASGMAETDSPEQVSLVKDQLGLLTRFAFEDLKTYISKVNKDTSKYAYHYDPKINQYLRLANSIKSKEFVSKFTRQLLDSKITGWMQTKAVTARVFNNLEVDDQLLSELLTSMDTRYTIMESLFKAGKTNKIPKKYRTQHEFAKTCFYEFMSYEDEVPDEIELLGHLIVDNKKVYVFSFWYVYNQNEKYIGLSGFYPTDSNKLEFDGHLSYTPWEHLLEDWQEQARLYLQDLKNYGY